MGSLFSKSKGQLPVVVVTGASGLLGRAIMKELEEESGSFVVVGTAFSRVKGNLRKVDLTNAESALSFLREIQPQMIINCAAERRPDVCEKQVQLTHQMNVVLPQILAAFSKETGAWVLHISTDYVFDGSSPPYLPTSPTNPLNAYGQSKLDAEVAVKEGCDNYGILRVPVLYGPTEDYAESATTILLKDILSKEPKKVDNWGTRYPTHVGDIAVVVRQLLKKKIPSSDVWHWSSNEVQESGEPFTKYQLCKLIGTALDIDTSHLTPDNEPPTGAPRPKDCHLDSSELRQQGFGRDSSLEKSLKEILLPFVIKENN